MFKTIHECRLDLVSHSRMVPHEGARGEVMCIMHEPAMDFMPCSSARVSFGNEDRTGQNVEADKKLMRYLAEHQHMTPFEYQHATFLVEVPLFIRSQIHRHRAFSYNEISRRYTSENLEFWIPDKWRKQATNNKQASTDEEVELKWEPNYYRRPLIGRSANGEYVTYQKLCEDTLSVYHSMVEQGVAREQARAVLPQSLLTKFYMGGNLRSWAHFIALRRDPHAQEEVRIVAEKIAAKLKELWPNSCEALGL